jgi:hypothetical protein
MAKKDRVAQLTEKLLADRTERVRRERERKTTATLRTGTTSECFLCGRGFTYRGSHENDSGRFCGSKCREAYDAEKRAPQYGDPCDVPLPSWIVVAGPPNVAVGSRYYEQLDQDLKAQRRRVEQRLGKIPDEELTRPRRTCAKCGGRIPVWIKGKKVSERRKLCLTCSPI